MLHPLDQLSESLRTLLLRVGWKPGNSRPERSWWQWPRKAMDWTGLETNFEKSLTTWGDHPARRIIDELYGLQLETSYGDVIWSDVIFAPEEGIAAANEINILSEILDRSLVPFGETRSESVMLIDEAGMVYLAGIASRGVFNAGPFDTALTAILNGIHLPAVVFDSNQDPDAIFTI